jgi:uncharacterized protein YlxP (DUF503 family)
MAAANPTATTNTTRPNSVESVTPGTLEGRIAPPPRIECMTEGFLGILRFELHMPESTSLKGKRKHLLAVKSRLERRFGASVAEIGHHELWQRSLLVMVVTRRSAGEAANALGEAQGYLSSQEFELARADSRVLSVEEAIE